MFRSKSIRNCGLAMFVGLGLAYAATSLSAQATGDGATRRDVNASTTQLYVMVDKPMYRPGETLWLRAWEMTVSNLEPVKSKHQVSVKLVDPRGGAVIEKKLSSATGAIKAAVDLPVSLTGGTYKLQLRSDRGISIEKNIVISTYERPQFSKKLSFHRDSYAAGADVELTVVVAKTTGEPLSRARITADVWLDGTSYVKVKRRANRSGTATLRFRLPASMSRGDGLVTIVVDYRGATESFQRRIPIAINAVRVSSYPEGGDLVMGMTSTVYFAAKDMLGGPVEIDGDVVDDQGNVVAKAATAVRGMGKFELSPQPGRTYSISISKPIAMTFPIGAAKSAGCVLREAGSTASDLSFDVSCSTASPMQLSATIRGLVVAQVSGHIGAGNTTRFRLPVADSRQGVARVTLVANKRHVAERLVYRGLGKDLRIEITPSKGVYSPRETVELGIKTTTPDGKPVAAQLALAVVDESVINLANDKTGHILAKIYLEPEMPGQVIEDPNFYFSGAPRARKGLDLLLGTQGWRRFR